VGSSRCSPDGARWYGCECAVYGAEVEVSPSGSDTDTGAPGHPFKTLARAQQRVREIIGQGVPAGGIVVWVREGVYELTKTLSLGENDSGTAGNPVVWRARPGESARISGGRRVPAAAFVPVDDADPVKARIDPVARDHVMRVDLTAQGISDFGALSKRGFCGAASSAPLELFIDGVAMTLARWPDADANDVVSGAETASEIDLYGNASPDVTGHYVKVGTQDGVSSFARQGEVDGLAYHLYRSTWDYQGQTHTAWFLTTQASGYPSDADPWWYRYAHELGPMKPTAGATGEVTHLDPAAVNHGFASIAERISDTVWRYHGDRPSRWNTHDAWFHGFWKHAWADCHVQASAIDTATKTVTLVEVPGYGIADGQPWYAYNLVEEITEPGEWWLDRATGKLYLWPPTGFAQSDVTVSMMTDPLIELQGASFVELRDLVLETGRSSLLRVSASADNLFEGLVLRNAGTDAVSIDGERNVLRSALVYGTGNGGVRVEGGDRPSLSAGGNVVENSHFHDLCRWEWTYRPAVSVHGAGNTARHNLIHHLPHSAILFGGNEHVIELNAIHDVCRFSSDAGAIYSGRDWGARGNVIRHNFIHDVATFFEGYGVHGVYLDDCLSGVRVEGNVLYRISGHAIQHGGGRDDIMVNNLAARCGDALSADSRGYEWQPDRGPNNIPGDSWNLLEKLQQVGYQQDPWASRYPECAAIPNDWNAIIAPGARWLFPEGSVFARNAGFANGAFIRATAGTLDVYASTADNLEDVDPHFVDEANLDLSLRPDSPVLEIPGWQDIPFDQIGLE